MILQNNFKTFNYLGIFILLLSTLIPYSNCKKSKNDVHFNEVQNEEIDSDFDVDFDDSKDKWADFDLEGIIEEDDEIFSRWKQPSNDNDDEEFQKKKDLTIFTSFVDNPYMNTLSQNSETHAQGSKIEVDHYKSTKFNFEVPAMWRYRRDLNSVWLKIWMIKDLKVEEMKNIYLRPLVRVTMETYAISKKVKKLIKIDEDDEYDAELEKLIEEEQMRLKKSAQHTNQLIKEAFLKYGALLDSSERIFEKFRRIKTIYDNNPGEEYQLSDEDSKILEFRSQLDEESMKPLEDNVYWFKWKTKAIISDASDKIKLINETLLETILNDLNYFVQEQTESLLAGDIELPNVKDELRAVVIEENKKRAEDQRKLLSRYTERLNRNGNFTNEFVKKGVISAIKRDEL